MPGRTTKLAQSLCVAAAMLQSGCGVLVAGTMTLANHVEQRGTARAIATVRAEQVADIKELQAAGDPMGNYLFAVASAQGWMSKDQISDAASIMEMSQRAADKGASDAMIALGLMLFDGSGAPVDSKVYLPFELQDWRKGLELVERGMRERCSYALPMYSLVTSPPRRCVVYRSPAIRLWPAFRDGRYIGNRVEGFVPFIQKDKVAESYWREKDAVCQMSEEVRRTQSNCAPVIGPDARP